MKIRLAQSDEDIQGINALNKHNLKKNIKDENKIKSEGYVSWEYSVSLLKKMQQYYSSIIAVDDHNQVLGYALVAFKQARAVHPELDLVLHKMDTLPYMGNQLRDYRYYAMGQICIAEEYRGQGVFDALYQGHKHHFQKDFDFVLTTIAISNIRSIRAHERIGFKTIHEFDDHFGNWIVVLWDWH